MFLSGDLDTEATKLAVTRLKNYCNTATENQIFKDALQKAIRFGLVQQHLIQNCQYHNTHQQHYKTATNSWFREKGWEDPELVDILQKKGEVTTTVGTTVLRVCLSSLYKQKRWEDVRTLSP